MRRIGQVHHHPDAVAEAVRGWRTCARTGRRSTRPGALRCPRSARRRSAPGAAGRPAGRWPGPAETRPGVRRPVRELLVVDQQQAVGDLHLVGVLRAGAGHWVTSTGRAGSAASSIDVPIPVVPVCPTYSASPCRITCMPSPCPARSWWASRRSPEADAVAGSGCVTRARVIRARVHAVIRRAPGRAPSCSATQSAVRYRWNGARLAQPWLPCSSRSSSAGPPASLTSRCRLLPGDEPVQLAHDGQQRAADQLGAGRPWSARPARARAVSGSGDMDRTRNASLVRPGRLSQFPAKSNGPARATQAFTRLVSAGHPRRVVAAEADAPDPDPVGIQCRARCSR